MRTVFLTGGTGAIGSALCRCLLNEPGTRVVLLMRARNRLHLQERLDALLAFLQVPSVDDRRGRLEAMAGDVTQPSLGLEPTTFRKIASSVTHIVHAAGNVKLNQPLADARRSAVASARQIAELAHACATSGQFVKAEFVSTVGVAGRTHGTVPEQLLTSSREFRNTYEAAKAEAEAFVAEEVANGLRATIHRPSMVVGDSHDGRIIQFQVFYHLCEFLSGARTAGFMPDVGDTRLDIVPVDYVAAAIQRSSHSREAVGRVFHLCSGPGCAPTLRELTPRVHEIFSAHGRPVRPLRTIPTTLLRALVTVLTPVAPHRLKRSLRTMPYFLTYLGNGQVFANTDTQRFFAAQGLTVPAVDSYLDTVLSYYLDRTQRPAVRSSRIAS